jgi:hypothetical protein
MGTVLNRDALVGLADGSTHVRRMAKGQNGTVTLVPLYPWILGMSAITT